MKTTILITKKIKLFTLLSLFIVTVYCGNKNSDNKNPAGPEPSNNTTVKVIISPSSVSLLPNATQQFKASVSGAQDTTVSWVLESGVGSITQNGLYTAPATINTDSVSVAVKAKANADPNAFASATVKVKKPTVDLQSISKLGYNTSQDLRAIGEEGVNIGAQAVFQASIINGGNLVSTGTLTQTVPNSLNFSYSASPADKLVVNFTDGSTIEFVIKAMQGDFSNNAETFLQNAHSFQLQINAPGIINAEVTSLHNNGVNQESLKGSFVYQGVTYNVDVTEQGTYGAEVGSSATYNTEDQTSGTITGPDFSLNINEYYKYKSIYVDNYVENVERRTNNSWTQNGSSFALQDVVIRKSFVNSKPSEIDSYWLVQGTFLQNGVPTGQVTGGVEGLSLKVWLQLPNEKIVLEEYSLN